MKAYKGITHTLICCALLAVAPASGEETVPIDKNATRTWTSTKGDTIEASFNKVMYGVVTLKKADGKTIKIKKTALSADDQKLVTEFASATLASKTDAKKGAALKKAPEAILALFGQELKNAKKKDVSVDTLTDKLIGVYFSAHWCPPCRAFTPKLVKFYNALAKENKAFEIVFVSSDRSKDAMYEYMTELKMPWLALPFGDKHKNILSKKYGVRGIPKLVILDSKGDLITGNGRNFVTGSDTAIYDKWAAGKER